MCKEMNVTVKDAEAGIGQYYRQHGRQFFYDIFCELKAEMYMTGIPRQLDEYTSTSVGTDNILQPYRCPFEPGPAIEFCPHINKVRTIKADIMLSCLKDLQTRYLGWMTPHDGTQRNFMSFMGYIMRQVFLPKIKSEIAKASFAGVYDAAGTNHMDIVDGWGTIIDTEIANGNIAPIPTGVINNGNIVDRVEYFLDQIDPCFLDQADSGVLLMSHSNAVAFFRDWRGQGFNQGCCEKGNDQLDQLFVHPYGIQIIGLTEMEGSDMFMYTPKSNFLKLYNEVDMPENFETQPFDRCLKLMLDFKRGYGFGRLDWVFVNDQPARP